MIKLIATDLDGTLPVSYTHLLALYFLQRIGKKEIRKMRKSCQRNPLDLPYSLSTEKQRRKSR